MNKSYRVIWNSTTGTWTVAPEICRARGKSTSRAVVAATTALMGALLPNVSHAIAAPGGGYLGLYVKGVSTAGVTGWTGTAATSRVKPRRPSQPSRRTPAADPEAVPATSGMASTRAITPGS